MSLRVTLQLNPNLLCVAIQYLKPRIDRKLGEKSLKNQRVEKLAHCPPVEVTSNYTVHSDRHGAHSLLRVNEKLDDNRALDQVVKSSLIRD